VSRADPTLGHSGGRRSREEQAPSAIAELAFAARRSSGFPRLETIGPSVLVNRAPVDVGAKKQLVRTQADGSKPDGPAGHYHAACQRVDDSTPALGTTSASGRLRPQPSCVPLRPLHAPTTSETRLPRRRSIGPWSYVTRALPTASSSSSGPNRWSGGGEDDRRHGRTDTARCPCEDSACLWQGDGTKVFGPGRTKIGGHSRKRRRGRRGAAGEARRQHDGCDRHADSRDATLRAITVSPRRSRPKHQAEGHAGPDTRVSDPAPASRRMVSSSSAPVTA